VSSLYVQARYEDASVECARAIAAYDQAGRGCSRGGRAPARLEREPVPCAIPATRAAAGPGGDDRAESRQPALICK
jgi:hypothetical protein